MMYNAASLGFRRCWGGGGGGGGGKGWERGGERGKVQGNGVAAITGVRR